MPIHVNIPSTVQTANPGVFDKTDWLDDALRVALTRAIILAKQQVANTVEELGAPAGVVSTHAPLVFWTGDGNSEVSDASRTRVNEKIGGILDDVIAHQNLPAKNQQQFSSRWRFGKRSWIVLDPPVWAQVKVSDYVDYLLAIGADPSLRTSLLDILDERRWLTIWVVKTKAAVTAGTLLPEVIRRMNDKDPLIPGETSAWGWSNFESQRQEIIRIDRTHRADGIPKLDSTKGLIAGGGMDAALLPGAKLMITRMKVPDLPQLGITVPLPEMLETWRKSLLEGDVTARRDAIDILIRLRRYPGVTELLKEGLDQGLSGSIFDFAKTDIRRDIVTALEKIPGRPYSIALLLLYGVGHPVEDKPLGVFLEWFKQQRGRDCLALLERVLNEESADNQGKAAKVLLHLLAYSRTEEAASYPANVTALRKLSQRQDLFTGGALGEESQKQLIEGQAAAIDALRKALMDAVNRSPSGDSHKTQNYLQLDTMGKALMTVSEDVAALDLGELEKKRAHLGELITMGTYVQERVDGLHNGVSQIQQFLKSSVETDETNVLFELRRDYVNAWANGLTDLEFKDKITDVDHRGKFFDTAVADVKWKRARREFQAAVNDVHQNRLLTGFGGSNNVPDVTFQDLKKAVKDEMTEIFDSFYPKAGWSGGTRVRTAPRYLGREAVSASNLDQAVKLETKVAIFRIHTAMFAHAAVATMLHDQIAGLEIGDDDFRRTQGNRLIAINRQIAEDFNKARFQQFIDRDPEVRETFLDVQRKIKDEVDKALFIEILITAAAALLTMGTGLLVRAALVGRTVGVLRTARAVETIVFLTDVAVFTGVQVGGQRIAFDQEITLSGTASAAAQNLAFLGAFRVLGKLTGPLLEKGAWGFVAVHSINLSAMTAIGAVATKIQAGEWPQDMKTFLLHSVGSYVVFMGVSAATRGFLLNKTALGPKIRTKIEAGAERLGKDSDRLVAEYRHTLENGTLSEPRFNRIKQSLRDNITQVRELAKQSRDAGLVKQADFEQFMGKLAELDAQIAAHTFPAQSPYLNSRGEIQALPAPETITSLVRQGDSNTYRYDPNTKSPRLETALARYESAGFDLVRHQSGLVQVKHPGGRLAFVLDPAPLALPAGPQPLALLPAGTATRPMTLLERSMGKGLLTEADTAIATTRLKKINRALLETLEAEFTDTAALLALRLFNRDFSHPWSTWKKDAVRGVGKMLEPQRGIMFRPVQRLFESRTQAELIELFSKYKEIADMPGADRIVSEELMPSSSLALVRVYDKLRIARIRLPQNMTRKAVQGLFRLAGDGRNVVKELARVDLDKRRARLEAESPLVDPRIRPKGSRESEVLRAQRLDIRPGLNLLSGTPAEVRVAIEARGTSSGGKFHDLAVRNELEKLITSYRNHVASFQSGGNVETNMIGKREELDTAIAAIESGAEVFSVGNIHTQPGRHLTRINLATVPLPGGLKVANAPTNEQLQLDVGATIGGGQVLIIEATTGELALPNAWKGLDPQSSASKTLDFSALNDKYATHRKVKQAIKMLAAAHIAHGIGGGKGPFPKIVFRVGNAKADAKRGFNFIGIEIVETNPKP